MDKETIMQLLADGVISNEVAERYFPELKENEDKKVRKELIKAINLAYDCGIAITKENRDKYLAWIERQGEQKPVVIIPKFRVGDVIHKKNSCVEYTIKRISDGHYYGDGFSFNIVGCDRDYELVKQKPTNKVEPKFKVGDWVVTNQGKVNQVVSVDKDLDGYTLDDGNYFSGSWCDMYHLWTIQDAKDGDVLEFGDHGRLVVGIVSYVNKTTGHVDVNCLLENNNFKLGNYYNLDTIKPHPATKEQRDLLFQKVEEVGYEWDADKKELKKIEQNSAWSEDDEIRHKTTLEDLEAFHEHIEKEPSREISKYHLMSKDSLLAAIQKDIDWFRTLKDKMQPQSTWKPSDEQMGALANACDGKILNLDYLNSLYQDLKKLREE